MNRRYEQHLVSPLTHRPLVYDGDGNLTSGEEFYEVIENIPILLPDNAAADWQRELVELILWEHPEEIAHMYEDLLPYSDPTPTYIKWIEKLVGGKEAITHVFERYEATDTQRWIVERKDRIDADSLAAFHRLCTAEVGKRRVESSLFQKETYAPFSKLTTGHHPKMILELATGAGTGTAAVALGKDADALLFSVDVDFACLGNVIGIGIYLNCGDTLLPVDANFWHLPFADGQMDIVCTVCGLDESRENDSTIAEAARVLKVGGHFVCVSRENGFMRQGELLEAFGFSREEIIMWLKRCRMYSDVETLKELCSQNGLRCVYEDRSKSDNGFAFVTTMFEKV